MREQSQNETGPVIVNFLEAGNEAAVLVESGARNDRAAQELPVTTIGTTSFDRAWLSEEQKKDTTLMTFEERGYGEGLLALTSPSIAVEQETPHLNMPLFSSTTAVPRGCKDVRHPLRAHSPLRTPILNATAFIAL